MSAKNRLKLVSEEVLPSTVLAENADALDLYKETDEILKETAAVLEQTAIALGKKTKYKYSFGSTQNCKINYHAIPPTTYKI